MFLLAVMRGPAHVDRVVRSAMGRLIGLAPIAEAGQAGARRVLEHVNLDSVFRRHVCAGQGGLLNEIARAACEMGCVGSGLRAYRTFVRYGLLGNDQWSVWATVPMSETQHQVW